MVQLNPMTPPLSPVSEKASPFIPDQEASNIDLTSEPKTPVSSRVQYILDHGCAESDPPVPSTSISPPSSRPPPIPTPQCIKVQDVKVDLPIVPLSCNTVSEDHEPVCYNLAPSEEVSKTDVGDNGSFFNEALNVLLADRHSYITRLVEQERLNPLDSISRVSVPILDFEISRPAWTTACANGREQLSWLQTNDQSILKLSMAPQDSYIKDVLKWTPLPNTSARTSSLVESLDQIGKVASQYLAVEGRPSLDSASYIVKKSSLAILQEYEDDEIEPLDPLSPMESGAQRKNTTDFETTSDDRKGSYSHHFTSNREPQLELLVHKGFRDLMQDGEGKRDDSGGLLPIPQDTSATSKLLDGFMDLRAIKRQRRTVNLDYKTQGTGQGTGQGPLQPAPEAETVSHEQQSLSETSHRRLRPAEAPEFDVPVEKSRILMSLSVPRAVFRLIEASWLAQNVIDRDYSHYHADLQALPAGRQRQKTSTLAFEADIALSPSVGIIVTSLLKARQKPLPGSTTQTQVRKQVQEVSQKYESLIVFVSECNPDGEYTGTLSAADVASYADFVSFTTALGEGILVYFVTGAEQTLAKWVLALMCQCSPHGLAFNQLLSAEDTAWEILLRRAGMNVVAAQVLSKSLFEEFGDEGLARFLSSTLQQRIARYEQLLGGRKGLMASSAVMDQPWS